jgi:hypothetical protein
MCSDRQDSVQERTTSKIMFPVWACCQLFPRNHFLFSSQDPTSSRARRTVLSCSRSWFLLRTATCVAYISIPPRCRRYQYQECIFDMFTTSTPTLKIIAVLIAGTFAINRFLFPRLQAPHMPISVQDDDVQTDSRRDSGAES